MVGMTGAEIARGVLAQLSSAVAARDGTAMKALFEEVSFLIGTTGHAIGAGARDAYIDAVVAQPGDLSWDWHEVIVNHADTSTVSFAALGDIVLTQAGAENRRSMRLTGLLHRNAGGPWRFLQFHGSLPAHDAP